MPIFWSTTFLIPGVPDVTSAENNAMKENRYFSIHGVPVFCNSPGCENVMILNPEKSHYMCLGKNPDDNEVLNFNHLIIKSSK